jgi:hypothetical protein
MGRRGWMAAGAVALVVLGLAFRARQVDLSSAAPAAPLSQSMPPTTAGRDGNDRRATPGAGGEPVLQPRQLRRGRGQTGRR